MKKIAAVVIVLGTFFAITFFVNAGSESYRLNPGNSGQYYSLDNSICRTITNNSGTSYFIPAKTNAEFTSFITYPPSGVVISSCTASCPASGGCGVTAHGASCTTYSAASAMSPTTCASISRTSTCSNGSWSATPYAHGSCSQFQQGCIDLEEEIYGTDIGVCLAGATAPDWTRYRTTTCIYPGDCNDSYSQLSGVIGVCDGTPIDIYVPKLINLSTPYVCGGTCAANMGQVCNSGTNACGQYSTGTILCNGSCGAGVPANPTGYGTSCTSAPNSCGQTNSGTIQCDGSCNATTPDESGCGGGGGGCQDQGCPSCDYSCCGSYSMQCDYCEEDYWGQTTCYGCEFQCDDGYTSCCA